MPASGSRYHGPAPIPATPRCGGEAAASVPEGRPTTARRRSPGAEPRSGSTVPSELAGSAAGALLLFAVGLAAGVVNTLAGGGSLLTVPALVLFGLPGGVANGTNRVGILLQSAVAAWRFRAEGVSGFREALHLLPALCLGSAVGALWVSGLRDETFNRLFGGIMLLLLVPTLRPPRRSDSSPPPRPWPPALRFGAFFLIGVYGGAIQAGVGLVLVLALARSGLDLVRANAVKVVVILAFTGVAVPVFVARGQVAWGPAAVLAAGFVLGAALGARLAVRGGERVIRPLLAAAVVALAGRMLGLL